MAVSHVAIITDSAASLPSEFERGFQVTTIPVHLTIGNATILDGPGDATTRVIDAMIAGATIATTPATPEEILEFYKRAAKAGATAIVSIHVSSAYSSMLANAREAADRSPIPVTLVDAGTTAMAQGLIVLGAAALALAGRTADECAGGALAVARSCRFLFTVENLDHLRTGGRVASMIRAVGNLLNIRPVVSILDGETTVVDRVHGDARAREVIRSSLQLYASTLANPVACVGVTRGSAADKGLALTIRGPVIETPVGGSLAAHTGPDTCGVAVVDMPPEFSRVLGAMGRTDDGAAGPT